jgi:hypothetical protein
VQQIRKRLTYANVMSSIAVFLILGGATAFAAKKIGSHQLKSNSVTTAKIKANAVTTRKIKKEAVGTAKIKNAAVTGEKIAGNTITGANINAETTPFGRVVAKFRGSGNVQVSTTSPTFTNYPLNPTTYTQAAEEDDSFVGAMNITFQSGCELPEGGGSRRATAFVLVDSPNPAEPKNEQIVAIGEVQDEGTGTVSKRLEIGPFIYGRFEPGNPTPHTVSLVVVGSCKTGTTGIVASSGAVDVIGTK